jgi:hypothetical protein
VATHTLVLTAESIMTDVLWAFHLPRNRFIAKQLLALTKSCGGGGRGVETWKRLGVSSYSKTLLLQLFH